MEDLPISDGASSRRRRGPGFVTPNACLQCKKKKTKCDGGMPCSRCAGQYGVECIYDTSLRSSKESLRDEIAALRLQLQESEIAGQNLRAQLQQNEGAVQGLSTLPSSGYISQQGNRMPSSGLANWTSLSSLASETAQVPGSDPSLTESHHSGQCTVYTEVPNQLRTEQQWTVVTSDLELVQHLCALYFKWEYPVFATVSKKHFLADFRTGRQEYCSPLVVNALLAVGCRFSDRPEARAGQGDENPGSHFFAEAKSLLTQENKHSLMAVQALGLMSIWKAGTGRDTESWFYSGQAIRVAVEMALQKPSIECSPEEQTVRTATFWGAFNLDQTWCLTFGRLPHVSMESELLIKPLTVDNYQSSDWFWQTEHGDALEQPSEQSGEIRSIHNCFCALSELVHSSLYVLYNPVSSVTTTKILSVYTRYKEWYDSLPDNLHQDRNPSPAALFVNMYYNYAMLLLFRPFINLRILKSTMVPHDICLIAADNILSLLNSYDRIYSFQNTPALTPYILLASTITHLMAADDLIPTVRKGHHVHQGATALQSISPYNPFAERAIYILKILARNWGVAISIDGPVDMSHAEQVCQRSSSSMNFFCPYQEGLLFKGSIQGYDNSLLFTPFPMQGLPVMGVDIACLKKSGFSSKS